MTHLTVVCAFRPALPADEADLLWLGNPCCKCRKPLGRDGVAIFCTLHAKFHQMHKVCLDGKPLDLSADTERHPILPLREVLQLGLFGFFEEVPEKPSHH